MSSLVDIENGSKMNFFEPLIENKEYDAYIKSLENYLKTGNTILDNWETLYSNDLQAFFDKLKTYIEYLKIFSCQPTIEKQLKLTSLNESLEELYSSFKLS